MYTPLIPATLPKDYQLQWQTMAPMKRPAQPSVRTLARLCVPIPLSDVPRQSAGTPHPRRNVAVRPRTQEVAPAYVFLASEDSSYFTGQTLHPNGGMPVSS